MLNLCLKSHDLKMLTSLNVHILYFRSSAARWSSHSGSIYFASPRRPWHDNRDKIVHVPNKLYLINIFWLSFYFSLSALLIFNHRSVKPNQYLDLQINIYMQQEIKLTKSEIMSQRRSVISISNLQRLRPSYSKTLRITRFPFSMK